MIKEYIKIAIRNLRTRRLRSWLTIIGVIIGIFLIISLLSLSEGLKTAILSQLRMMGKSIVMVYPGDISNIAAMMTGDLQLSDSDLKTIKKTKGVEIVVPVKWKAKVVRYYGKRKTLLIYANQWKEALEVYKNDMGWSLKEGRWPIPGKKEVVVGSLVKEEIFPNLRVGTSLDIDGKKFQIVGILNSVGSKQDDSMIGLDFDIFEHLTGEKKGARFAFAKIHKGVPVEQVVWRIKNNLNKNRKRRKNEEESSFTVLTSEKVSNIVGNIMGLIQAVIIGFASVAIIVGGIGIMNTMYTAVRERTKEIGILKAIGARNRDITNIFLIESGFFGLIGGVGGILLGLVFAKIVEAYFQFHPVFYLKASITPQLICFGLLFSFAIGCISGYLPARNAAKLNPVDALRYE